MEDKLDFEGRNAWLEYGPLQVYIRKSQIPTEIGPNLQIANVSVAPEFQHKGHFTRFLRLIETYAVQHQWSAVYVENIINPVLEDCLRKHGYTVFTKIGLSEYPPCMFKRM